jgi:hypothetical protein
MSLKWGGPHEKHKLELGKHLSIYLKTEENQENQCRDGRSQDLPDAY